MALELSTACFYSSQSDQPWPHSRNHSSAGDAGSPTRTSLSDADVGHPAWLEGVAPATTQKHRLDERRVPTTTQPPPPLLVVPAQTNGAAMPQYKCRGRSCLSRDRDFTNCVQLLLGTAARRVMQPRPPPLVSARRHATAATMPLPELSGAACFSRARDCINRG